MLSARTINTLKKMVNKPEIGYAEGQFKGHVERKISHYEIRDGRKQKIYTYRVVFRNMDCFEKSRVLDLIK